jgi:hypothetical protein
LGAGEEGREVTKLKLDGANTPLAEQTRRNEPILADEQERQAETRDKIARLRKLREAREAAEGAPPREAR